MIWIPLVIIYWGLAFVIGSAIPSVGALSGLVAYVLSHHPRLDLVVDRVCLQSGRNLPIQLYFPSYAPSRLHDENRRNGSRRSLCDTRCQTSSTR